MVNIKRGKTFEESIQALSNLSHNTHERLYKGITLLEEGAPLEEVLKEISSEFD